MGQAILSGLVGGWLASLFLGWAVQNARAVSANREGWRTISPGAGVLLPLFGAAGFSLLLLYIYFFVGSARADAERQMMYCLGLAIAFAAGSAALAWNAFSHTVSWRGSELRVAPLFGAPVMKRLSDLAAVDYRSLSSMFHLTFADGSVVKISPYMRGTKQLLDHIGHLPEHELRPR